jgi:choice-of-anchor B domain-containing protein
MRLLLIASFCLCFGIGFSQVYESQNVNLLGHWDDSTIVPEPQLGIRYNGCFGWENPADGRRYAIIGSSRSTHVIEVTNPSQPTFRWEIIGSRINCIWREIKTYGKYGYIVSDDGYPNRFQIADLSYLPDSVHLVMDSDSIFARTHTIFVDGNKLYCASVHSAGQNGTYSAMNVYSLANPEKPLLLRRLEQDYPSISQVHDMWVRNDTIFASSAYQGLSILTFDTVQNKFNLVSTLTVYDDAGYNHSSTWSKDGKTLVMMDEVPNSLPAKVVNVSDITQPYVTAYFNSSDSTTPHNPYFIGDSKICVGAHYEDGTQIYDVSNENNPVRLGYFDTHWQTTAATNTGDYRGNWGSYVDFGGGLVISGDMQNGLFVLDISPSLLGFEQRIPLQAKVWPLPSQSLVFIDPVLAQTCTAWSLRNAFGQVVKAGQSFSNQGLSIQELVSGYYHLSIRTTSQDFILKVVKE